MNDRTSFLDELKRLPPAQFEEVMFRLGVESWIIPGPFAAQVLRSTDLLRRLAQEEGWERRLREVLADRTLETIGKQYEGYETEEEVRTIVSDYVKQPIAGRSQEQEQIEQFLRNNTSGTLLITAPAGFGKSSLLMHWQAHEVQQQDYFIAFHCFRTSSAVLRSISNAYRHLLRQLYVYYNRREKQFPDENGMRDILFGMIRDCGVRKDKPLVIILDGLDEAEKTFDPLFSLPLPDHVYVIASARAEEKEKPAYLYNWVDIAQRLYLDRLPRHAIPKWLEKIKELEPYAQDEDFSGQIYERTEGIPLFAKYLLDELVNTAKLSDKDAIYEALRNVSKGFNEYIKQQFNDLEKLEAWQRDKARQFFYFMTIAKGELSSKDMVKLIGENPPMPWQVSRWFKIRESKDGRLMYSFAHAILAQRFALVPQVKDNADASREKLIEYCADWESHNSPYALRYYAEHLRDEAKSLKARKAEALWKELYELARNKEYAVTQQEILPDEPDLPLETIKLALQSKAEVDEAAGMAEFLLLHAKRKLEIAQESPLEALRAGSLERAWKLAGQASREDCILWHLLLAWALVTGSSSASEGLVSARKTMEQLQLMQLPRLSDWKADYAVYLLGQILPVLQQEYLSLIKQVLANDRLKDLRDELIKEGKGLNIALKFADKLAQQLKSSYDKAEALKGIVIAQLGAGDVGGVQATLNTALIAVQQIESSYDKLKALKEIAIAQATAGDAAGAQATLNTALTTARQIEDSSYKAKALTEIAIAQLSAGDAAGAQATLNTALTTARQIKNSSYKAKALTEIAIAQLSMRDTAGAQATLTTALTTAQQIEWASYDKAEALKEIAIAQAIAGDAASALTTARLVESSYYKAPALTGIAIAQLSAGDAAGAQATLTTALTTAWQIKRLPNDKTLEVLKEIAIAQAKAGDGVGALTTARQIKNSFEKAEALKEIAATGDVAGALTTAQQIEDPYYKAEALKEIAIAQADAGDATGARATMITALTATHEIGILSSKISILKDIAIAQVTTGDADGALNTARWVESSSVPLLGAQTREDAHYRVSVLKKIAQVAAGGMIGAQAALTTALAAAQQIEDSYDRMPVLKDIAAAQVAAGDTTGAQSTLNIALTTTQETENSASQAEVLKDIAIAQATAGDAIGALTTARQIENSASQAKALKDITIAQATAGDAAAALTTAQQIESLSDKAEVRKAIAIAQATAGDAAAALTTAQQIERSHDKDYKAKALKDVATTQVAAGDTDGALTTAQYIENEYFKIDALKDIAIAQANTGNAAGAQATLNTVLITAQQIESSDDKAKALQEIAIAQATTGDAAGAQATLNTALTTAQQIEFSYSKANILEDIAIAQVVAGDIAGALTTALQIQDSSFGRGPKLRRASVLKEIAIAQVVAGDIAGALTTTQQIETLQSEDLYDKVSVLREIAIAQAAAGDIVDALTTVQQIENSSDKAKALKDIAIAQVATGDATGAQATLNTALTIAQEKISFMNAKVLQDIAIAQVATGDGVGALTTVQQIENSSDKAKALKDIAIAQVATGDATGALITIQRIENSVNKAFTLKDIAIAMVKAQFGGHAIVTAEQILTDLNKHLPEIAATFVELGDTTHFKQLLIPCADYLDAAYAMCGHLAKLYPGQATEIAQVFIPFTLHATP